jgi:NAD(P)-dependent dehydrogenase (short-subunit alcohol dehydrogenase family)
VQFADRKVLVVGGSSGIGAAVVKSLIVQGAEVYNLSRTASSEDGVSNISLDVTSDFSAIEGLPDSLDGLVYCPGTINLKPFQALKLEDYQRDMEVNLFGAIKVIKATLKLLKKGTAASVVMYSTVAVSQGMSYHSSIAAAKGAVEGLVKTLAAENARSNIRFNAIAPSLTDTPLAANLLSSEEKVKASEDRHPLKKVGTAGEMSDATLFLLGSQSTWMTGQVLHIDGGMSSIRPL